MESNLIKEARAKLKTVMILNLRTAGFRSEKRKLEMKRGRGKKGNSGKRASKMIKWRGRRSRKEGVKIFLPSLESTSAGGIRSAIGEAGH